MKKFYLTLSILFLLFPLLGNSQCSTTNATSCQCPPGGGTNCDLVPDIAIARLPLTQTSNYTEYPQVCVPPCSGNDGRLRLGVSTPIIGFGPLETRGTSKYVCGTDTVDAGTVANIPTACPVTGLPPHQLINQRIYHKNGNIMTFTDRAAGSMTYHPSHGHQHIDNWGIYTLRTSNGDPNPVNWPIIGSGTKLGFCLLDISSCNSSSGYCTDSAGNTLNSTNIVNYGLGGGNYGCSNTVQGISNGYMDTYSQSLDGMWINLPPGLCNGTYYVVIQIDPFNYFQETNENNNVVAVPITLTQQGGTTPVITAGGPTTFCSGGSVILTSSAATNYFWSTGATTQSITVNASGSYSVTVNTGSSCSSTSQPITVTVTSIAASASAGSSALCAGQSTTLSVTHNASGTATVPTPFTNNTQVFIPDNNSTGVTSSITVSGISPTTLSSGMVVSVKLNLTHTYDGDLIVSLISPSGNQINLSNRRGGSGDNFTNTIFSMSAATAIANGTAPFTGSYIPDGSLNSLTGNVNGLWRLKVADVAANDTGRIRNWTLTLNNVVSAPPVFSWTSNPAGFTSSTQNPTITPAATTTYTVIVTSASGCTGSNSVTVSVNPLPPVTAGNVSGCIGTSIALSGIPAGGTWSVANPYTGPSTTYTYTYTDGNGCTNTSAAVSITVNPLPTVTASNVSGCAGTSIALSGTPAGGTWSIANPYTGPSTTYTYTYTDGNACTNTSSAASITVNPLPTVTASNVSGCVGTSIALSGTPAGGSWSFPNPYTGPSTTYTYTYTDGNGCTNTSSAASITVNPLPTVSFSGLASSYNVLASSATLTGSPVGGTFSGPGISGNTFNPSIAGVGGPYIITYSYTDGNGCSNSFSQQTTVVNCTSPGQPGSITAAGGNTKVCPGDSKIYSIAVVSGATSYTWTPPAGATIVSGQGTVTATVNYTGSFTVSGTLSVVSNNACGSSATRTLTITRNNPATPGLITGSASAACAGTTGNYSVANVSGITYNWIAPANASISSGQGTNSVIISFSASFISGSLSVTANNNCGTSAARALNIASLPSTPSVITGASTQICAGTSSTYSVTNVAGVTYNWTPPANTTISSGQGTNIVTVDFSSVFTSGTLTVAATNNCGSSALRTKAISSVPGMPGGITGSAYGNCNATSSFSIAAVANATSYTWSTNVAGAVVTPSGTSASISFPVFTSGIVSVTANNSCGSGPVRNFTAKGSPVTPTTITGATSVCANQFGVPYSIAPVASATTYTWTGMSGSHISDGVTTSPGTSLTTSSTNITVNFGNTAGVLNVKANNACGVSSSSGLSVGFVCKSAEIQFNAPSLDLYPNPAKEFVDISYRFALSGNAELTITDITGREIYSDVIISDGEEINRRINLKEINKGIYFVTVSQSEQKITRKLILN